MKLNYFGLFLVLSALLIDNVKSSPVRANREAPLCEGNDLLKYELDNEYLYDYNSNTTLWINDVLGQSKSQIELNAQVVIQLIEPCLYQLKLQNVNLAGETVTNGNDIANELTKNIATFRIEKNGALAPLVKFKPSDTQFTRNVKRAIISTLQLRSENELRSINPFDENDVSDEKSAVVYETDSLGRCRTTYKFQRNGDLIEINKEKSLHSCSLDESISSTVQHVPYNDAAEYNPGRLFVDSHKCKINVVNNLIDDVQCKHKSTYAKDAQGEIGPQALVKQSLKFNSKKASPRPSPIMDRAAPSGIVHEYVEHDDHNDPDFDASAYLDDACNNVPINGLNIEHGEKFRNLAKQSKKKSKSDLLAFIQQASSKCKLAGQIAVSAALFTESDSAVEASLDLIDREFFKDFASISEYPILSVLARHRNPSSQLIENFQNYLRSKPSSFPYLKKLYLIYSTLVKTHCSRNYCSNEKLSEWSSLFAENLGTNCLDSKNADFVISSLKAIGNIGYAKDTKVLEKCATEKANKLETRISAIEAFRRFPCGDKENLDGNYAILKDADDDSEIRIKAFLALTQCINSNKFQTFASQDYADLLLNDADYQVVSFIIDFAKERGATLLLNPILANPRIRDRLQSSVKEFSWHNFKYEYSLEKDGACEVAASVVYTPKSFIPRSINLNVTAHAFGLSTNGIDATVRLQGLDEILKAAFVDKLSSEALVKQLLGKPEQLLPILNVLASKLKYTGEKPYISLSVRVYGAEIFFSQLDSVQKLQQLFGLFGSFKSSFYKNVEFLQSGIVFDSSHRKALANGLELGINFDAALSLYRSMDGFKNENEGSVDFKLKLLRSGSFLVTQESEIELNGDNRLGLVKKVYGNSRIKLDADGKRQDGQVVYNLNLTPQKEIPLFTIDGKFYKLGANSKYVEIESNQFNVNYCTTQNFHENIGLDFCLTKRKPVYVKGNQAFDVDEVDGDDLFEDDDSADSKPKHGLTGPFFYQISLKNTELIKKLVLNAKWSGKHCHKAFEASLQSQSSTDVQRKLDVKFTSHRNATNRGFSRGFDLEVFGSGTGDVRLKLAGNLSYRKKELLDLNFVVDNKILKECHAELHLNRKQNDENIAANYHLEAFYDSKVSDRRFHRLVWDFTPVGKSIQSEAAVETLAPNGKSIKIAEAQLNLDPVENTDSFDEPIPDTDYHINFNGKTIGNDNLNIHGRFGFGLLHSNVDLIGNYTSSSIFSPDIVTLKAGHTYDTANPSVAHFDIAIPRFGISNGIKLSFEILMRTFIQLEIHDPRTKSMDAPYMIYYSKSSVENDKESSKSISLGFKNFYIDISSKDSLFARALSKVDDDGVLRGLSFDYSSTRDLTINQSDVTIELKKNSNPVITIHTYNSGNFGVFQNYNTEIDDEKLKVGIEFKLLEYQGGIHSYATVATSASKNTRKVLVNVHVKDIAKPLLKLSEAELRAISNGNNIDFNLKLITDGAQFKTLELKGVSNLKDAPNGDKELEVEYVKTFVSEPEKRARGILKYSGDDFKNFNIDFNIPNILKINSSLKNQVKPNEIIGTRQAKLNYVYLDQQNPEEGDIELFIDDKEIQPRMGQFTLLVRNRLGAPNQLDSNDKIKQLIEINIVQSYLVASTNKEVLISHKDDVKFISKALKVDISSSRRYETDKDLNIKYSSKTNAQLPAAYSGGEIVTLKGDSNLEITQTYSNLKYDLNIETDSSLIGRFLRYLNLNYQHKVAQNKLFEAQLNSKYRLPPNEDGTEQEVKNIILNFDVDKCDGETCVDLNLDLKKEALNCGTYLRFKKDGSFAIQSANDMNLFSQFKINCNQHSFTDTTLSFARNVKTDPKGDSDTYSRREIEVNSKSGFYEPKKFKLIFGPLHRRHGSLALGLAIDNTRAVEYSFDYDRDIDLKTGELKHATYKGTAQLGSLNKKQCELKIQNGNDYSNSFQCTLNLANDQNQYEYGYNLLVRNKNQLQLGSKDVEVDLKLPVGRQLHFEFKSNKAASISQDNDDPENENEFNKTLNIYWDYSRDKQKAIFINAKRDNYAPGKSKFSFAISNPLSHSIQLAFNHERLFNETNLNFAVSYDLPNRKNKLSIDAKLYSDLKESRFSIEKNLERPNMNIFYSRHFDKLNGKLKTLKIRVAKLLTLAVDEEVDRSRDIHFELYNKDENKYSLNGVSTNNDGVYVVEGSVLQNDKKLSTVKSVFNSNNANLKVNVDAHVTNQNYELDAGLLDETSANGKIKRNNEIVGAGTLKLIPIPVQENVNLNELVLELRWKRFWHQLQEDILGGAQLDIAEENNDKLPPEYRFNSYFGDAYGQIVSDIKPLIETVRNQRKEVQTDLKRSFGILLSYYAKYAPSLEIFATYLQDTKVDSVETSGPMHTRYFYLYRHLAEDLNIHLMDLYQTRFWRLAEYIPTLPRITYNMDYPLLNNLIIKKKLFKASNLYQVNAEYRERIRKFGEKILEHKSNLIKSSKSNEIFDYIKYALKPNRYTIVGTVYNRRNVLGFDGEHRILLSQCRYLLAHETSKNRFSIILNYNDKPHVLSVYLYGKGPFNLNENTIALVDKQLTVPQTIKLDNGKSIKIDRTNDALCIHIKNEVKVCCFADSNSCSVAFSKWYTGRIDGLLGKSDNFPNVEFSGRWGIDCRYFTGLLKPASKDAVQKCHEYFGNHEYSSFSDAFLTIRPEGWRKVCGYVTTFGTRSLCNFLKAFSHHAKLQSIDVDLPHSCYQCKNPTLNKNYEIGERINDAEATEQTTDAGADLVFLSLGCPNSYLLDYSSLAKQLGKSNNYYLIGVNGDDVSIHQSSKGNMDNFNIQDALKLSSNEKINEVNRKAFEKAIFYAQYLFSKRVASARHLIILSCGNCLPYSISTVNRLYEQLAERNIIVSSFGNYNMDLNEENTFGGKPFGYDEKYLYFYKENQEPVVDSDDQSSYKYEHDGDVCHKLAVLTHGSVFDLKSLQKPGISQHLVRWINDANLAHTSTVDSCRLVKTNLGNLADFKYTEIAHVQQPTGDEFDSE